MDSQPLLLHGMCHMLLDVLAELSVGQVLGREHRLGPDIHLLPHPLVETIGEAAGAEVGYFVLIPSLVE